MPNPQRRPRIPQPRAPQQRPVPAKARPKRRARRKPGWVERARWVWRTLATLPRVVQVVLVLSVLAVGAAVVNTAHWVVRKPTVLLAPISGALAKTPAQTWDSYGDDFRRHSTAAVSAELLAALAQMESAGDPVADTYWRWNPDSPDFFGLFRPASSSVGLYQMTDPAFEEASRYCIRDHVAVDARAQPGACGPDLPRIRLLPSHAIELTAAWLDRGVAKAVGKRPATARHMQDTAAIIHLCGGAPARDFATRGFRLVPGQRCGDHDPAAYLAQVHQLEGVFRKLAAR